MPWLKRKFIEEIHGNPSGEIHRNPSAAAVPLEINPPCLKEVLIDAMRYKYLRESAGYEPTYERSLEGREDLVYHCGSGVLEARVPAFAVESWP